MTIRKKINIVEYDLYFFLKDYFDKNNSLPNKYLITLFETLKNKLTKDEENSIGVKYYEELVYIDGKTIEEEYDFEKENLASILQYKRDRFVDSSPDILKLLIQADVELTKYDEPEDRKMVDIDEVNYYKEIER